MCNYVKIEGGYCLVCSDDISDYNRELCWCNYGYTKGKSPNPICFSCPTGCKICDNPSSCFNAILFII